jgi:hypothetical protein
MADINLSFPAFSELRLNEAVRNPQSVAMFGKKRTVIMCRKKTDAFMEKYGSEFSAKTP